MGSEEWGGIGEEDRGGDGWGGGGIQCDKVMSDLHITPIQELQQ